MKHSITKKITFIIISLVAGTVIVCWLLNATLLERYYISNKQESLWKALMAAVQANEEGTLYGEESRVRLEQISSGGNITMTIINPDWRVIMMVGGGSDEQSAVAQAADIMFATQDEGTEILSERDGYKVGKYKDSRLNVEYLILWGVLGDGQLVYLRTALESIRESVDISNRFLAYLGIFSIVASAVISYIVTRRITNPILQLADLSSHMTNLDFDAKFESRGKDEIDFLGEHMNELSETLEQTISELKTANNELMIDIEKKNQIDDMRKDFLSNVSHELKTPLALIQGYAEGLKECINDDDESRDFYCDVIMDEADKMNRMVKQLLTLNQLEFGNDTVTMERFDVTEVIRGVVNATAILREQSGITLEFLQQEPVFVWADEFKTEEVFTNFMSNAIHYAAGEKRIAITLEQRGEVVRISVFNTGSQIPEEDIEKIWTKFYKVDKARTREYGGSGIGLSIVKAIMESFHRECGVINHADGVEFWFELDCSGVNDKNFLQ